MKKILFVTYGSGHAAMTERVVRALAAYPEIAVEILALTLGSVYFKRLGLPYKSYKDYVTAGDERALVWGRKLTAENHDPTSGIEEAEAIAYLGLSYWDLVTRLGEAKAAALWAEKKRHAFLPLTVLARVIDRVNPDMVVTTNSPRSEYAAQLVARERGIPTMAMVDLFGLYNFNRIQADYVTVISQLVVDNLRTNTGLREGQKFLITGNPAFDQAFEYKGPINPEWRRKFFSSLPENANVLLWIDEGYKLHSHTGIIAERSDEEVTTNLDSLAAAARVHNVYLLVRPHPSQKRAPFEAWMKSTAHPHVQMAADVPLYPLLNLSDVVAMFSSTVGCEALMMGRPLIQLEYYPNKNTIPLGPWGAASLVKDPGELAEAVRQAFFEKIPESRQLRIAEIFPQERAAPKIAAAIKKIVAGETVE